MDHCKSCIIEDLRTQLYALVHLLFCFLFVHHGPYKITRFFTSSPQKMALYWFFRTVFPFKSCHNRVHVFATILLLATFEHLKSKPSSTKNHKHTRHFQLSLPRIVIFAWEIGTWLSASHTNSTLYKMLPTICLLNPPQVAGHLSVFSLVFSPSSSMSSLLHNP